MCMLLTVIQTFCIVALTTTSILLGLDVIQPVKYRKVILLLLAVFATGFISTTVVKDRKNDQHQKRLSMQIEKLRDSFFRIKAQQIMEGQIPICQIKSSWVPPHKKVEHLEIKLPEEWSKISGQFYIEGLVPDTGENVFIIFHSIASPDFLVQPEATICEDNIWRVRLDMDKVGGISVGSVFEIIALANPEVDLKEIDVLSGLPKAQWKSQIVEAIRK